MTEDKKRVKTYFPRHDDLSQDAADEKTAREFLTWWAEQLEEQGDLEGAKHLREEAAKPLKKSPENQVKESHEK